MFDKAKCFFKINNKKEISTAASGNLSAKG